MQRIALFPGSFDPITLGHVDVLQRAMPLFDKIIVAIGIHSGKQPLYSIEQRMHWMEKVFEGQAKIEVKKYTGLTIDFCREVDGNFLLRGIRSSIDFEYEKAIAAMNKTLAPNIETIFLACSPQYAHVSSTIVRDIIKNDGDARAFLPSQIDLQDLM